MKPRSIIIAESALQREITDRGDSFNGVANRLLQRYFDIVSAQRNTLRRTFDQNELSALLDANNGVLQEPIGLAVSALPIGVADAVELDGLADKWNIDGPALVAKLTALPEFQRLALIDWIERTWNQNTADWSDLGRTI